MAVASALSAGAQIRPIGSVQEEIALKVINEQKNSDKELVAELMERPQQIPAQVYNSNGQVIPSPSGSSVDVTV
jgi:hypothetical protein